MPRGRRHVVVAAPPAVRAPDDLARIAGAADWIELRLDLLLPLGAESVAQWVAGSPRPVLLTLRSKAEGGAFEGSIEEAAHQLGESMHLPGVVAVDLEPEVDALVEPCPAGVLRIVSTHTWERAELPAPPDSIRKRAVLVADAETLARAKALQVQADGFVVPFGRLAAIRTAFLPADRLTLLFGAANEDAAVVPHQPTLLQLLDELRAGEVGLDAELFGLVGSPPAWSPSPAMHNAVFRAMGRNALYVPLPGLDVHEATTLGVLGLSVTMPHKSAASGLAGAHDPGSLETGAANTLLPRQDDGWWAGNTDVNALSELLPPMGEQPRSAYVLGAGGFAAAVVAALRAQRYLIRVGGRDPERTKAFAERMHVECVGPRYEPRDTDAIVVNATPAGADGLPVAAFLNRSLRGLVVVDAPYRPADAPPTGLVQQASADGAAAIVDGCTLLATQAASQAICFGADEGDSVALRQVIDLALHPPASLWLLGIRGAGKTSVGRAVARALGRPFLDLDEEVMRTTGRTPAEWIEADGLAAFRYIETRVVETAAARQGVVIATGGGVVESETNRSRIADQGFRVWLDVSAEHAASRVADDAAVRPPLFGATDAKAEAEEALHRRGDLYRELADAVVDADPDLRAVVSNVRAAWLHARTT